jgi:guanosine-3',5'-bis(diphosphate) 3'-pyrophosphohydrolase
MDKGLNLAKILDAAIFAAEKHQGDVRKNKQRSPYITHPLLVAQAIVQIGEIQKTDILAAAILHDTIEDTDTTRGEIKERFGEDILSIVLEVTDDKALPKMVRKRLQVAHAAELSYEAKIVKLGDKLINCSDILKDPPDYWPLKRRQDYIQWGADVIFRIRGTNPQLEEAFDQVMARAERKLGYHLKPFDSVNDRPWGPEYKHKSFRFG